MRILANENIPKLLIKRLRELGYFVADLKQEGPGISDEAVVARAMKLDEIVLTQDKDYLIVHLKSPKFRLVVLRLFGVRRNDTPLVAEFLHKGDYLQNLKSVLVVRLDGDMVSIEKQG